MIIFVGILAFIAGIAVTGNFFWTREQEMKERYEREAWESFRENEELFHAWEGRGFEIERLKNPILPREELVKKLETYKDKVDETRRQANR